MLLNVCWSSLGRCVWQQTLAVIPLGLGLSLALTTQAGPIDPPAGPVESTMKTLAEVEPRTAINSANTPGDGDAVFVITEPGSYYLTGGLLISGTFDFPSGTSTPRDGIRIEADNVTIDLNGFSISGGLFGPRSGIVTDPESNVTNIVVRNGTIENFQLSGISIYDGGLFPADDDVTGYGRIEDVTVRGTGSNTAQTAINASRCEVRRCSAIDNVGTGIRARAVFDSVARGNDDGISGGSVHNSSAVYNADTGIRAGTAIGCDSSNNGVSGIIVTDLAADCTSRSNFAGVAVDGGAIARDCVAEGNEVGILSLGDANRVERCLAANNTTGFESREAGSTFVGNIASGNDTNWSIVAGNLCHVVLRGATAAVNGDSGGTPQEFSPWTNFTQP